MERKAMNRGAFVKSYVAKAKANGVDPGTLCTLERLAGVCKEARLIDGKDDTSLAMAGLNVYHIHSKEFVEAIKENMDLVVEDTSSEVKDGSLYILELAENYNRKDRS